MNLKKIEKGLQELFNKELGLNFTFKTEDGVLEARQSVCLYGRSRPVDCAVWFFEKGSAMFSFHFGKMPYTADTLAELLKFNRDVTFLKGTVSSDNLVVMHEVYVVDEKNAAAYAKGIFGVLVSDEVTQALKQLLDICDAHAAAIEKAQADNLQS